MQLHGPAAEIMAACVREWPELPAVQARILTRVAYNHRAIAPYQAAALYALARTYPRRGTHFLEIGTALGYSAAHLAEAAPYAHITTLNPKEREVPLARAHLAAYPNVTVVQERSWDYLEQYTGPELDLLFVDGDHARVVLDLPWWNWLRVGGAVLFHDYAPNEASRPCYPVWAALNTFREDYLRRAFDITIIDDEQVGMAGWYRRSPEPQREFPGCQWALDMATRTWRRTA